MHPVVLAVYPARVCGYAIVQGYHSHEAGSWVLLEEVRTSGRYSTPHAVQLDLMAKSLQDAVEQMAMSYSVDAVVIADPNGEATDMRAALVRAATRASYVAKCDHRLVDADCWLDGIRSPAGSPADMAALASGLCAADGIAVPCAEAAVAVMLGRHGSTKLGIYPVDGGYDLGV